MKHSAQLLPTCHPPTRASPTSISTNPQTPSPPSNGNDSSLHKNNQILDPTAHHSLRVDLREDLYEYLHEYFHAFRWRATGIRVYEYLHEYLYEFEWRALGYRLLRIYVCMILSFLLQWGWGVWMRGWSARWVILVEILHASRDCGFGCGWGGGRKE